MEVHRHSLTLVLDSFGSKGKLGVKVCRRQKLVPIKTKDPLW